jgi:hypothetical protein
MRHILLPRPIAMGTQRMGNATTAARLVALSGLAQPLAPGDLGTAAGTIDLAAIAAAADEHLSAATGTQKETRWALRPSLRAPDVDEAGNEWDTVPAFVLCTVWSMAPMLDLAVWIGAMPVFPIR